MGRTELNPRAVARVIAAYGFEAIRGRPASGSGAAPSHRLAELHLEGVDSDKRTVARKAAKGLPSGSPPVSSATPFDFAVATLFDWSRNGGQASFEAALNLMGELVVPLEPEELYGAMASLLRLTVQVEFDDPDARFLTGFSVQTAALDFIRERDFRRTVEPEAGEERSEESLAWARWLIERRRHEVRQTAEGYEAVLTFGLLLFRRRPKPGYSIAQIVRAAQSLWTGAMHRVFLEPDLYPEYGTGIPSTGISPTTGLPVGDGQIERAMVDLFVGMTEESLFSVNLSTLESHVVTEGLRLYRTADSIVPLESVTEPAEVSFALVREQFPSDRDLASACLRWLGGEWTGFDTFAHQFREAARAAAVVLLEWVSRVRRDFPILLQSAGFSKGDPAFDEVVVFVSLVLSQRAVGGSAVANPADVKWARRCVEEAANGGDWRKVSMLEPSTATPDAQI
jgi:hypothetical protein